MKTLHTTLYKPSSTRAIPLEERNNEIYDPAIVVDGKAL